MDIKKLIEEATYILKKNFIKSAGLDSEILMSKVINKNRDYIILNLKEKLDKKKIDNYRNLVIQRSNGKPIAYLVEKKDFWKYEFKIDKNVLIPRPDTEIIVEEALELTKNKSKLRVLDIGIGSGCILLSILKEKNDFYGTGVDVSKKCLKISKINAFRLGVLNRIKLFKSNIDNFNYGKYDLIISNPPYINKLDLKCLEKDIIDFEPKIALCGGIDGLSEIKKVIDKSSKLIKKRGRFILEVGFNQKNNVKRLLRNKGFYINKIVKDLANNDRCIVSTKI
jgi:release factor glutamine methyltransferase